MTLSTHHSHSVSPHSFFFSFFLPFFSLFFSLFFFPSFFFPSKAVPNSKHFKCKPNGFQCRDEVRQLGMTRTLSWSSIHITIQYLRMLAIASTDLCYVIVSLLPLLGKNNYNQIIRVMSIFFHAQQFRSITTICPWLRDGNGL